MKLIPVILVATGTIASFICVYFVIISLLSKNEASHSVEATGSEAMHQSANKQRIKSNNHMVTWKIEPDSSFDEFNFLPDWGTYRPGYYFGMKSMKSTLSTGLMWFDSSRQNIRHQTNQDEITQMEWLEHDGSNFGRQKLVDNKSNLVLETSFAIDDRLNKNEVSSWYQKLSMRQQVRTEQAGGTQMVYYFAADCFSIPQSDLPDQKCVQLSSFENIEITTRNEVDKSILLRFIGRNRDSNDWTFLEFTTNDSDRFENWSYLLRYKSYMFSTLNQLKKELLNNNDAPSNVRNKREFIDEFGEFISYDENRDDTSNGNFLAVSFKANGDSDIFISYREGITAKDAGDVLKIIDKADSEGSRFEAVSRTFAALFQQYQTQFSSKFDNFISLTSSEFKDKTLGLAKDQIKTCLSSLLGGIGYFEGHSRLAFNVDASWDTIEDLANQPPQLADPRKPNVTHVLDLESSKHITRLLTATPSRTIFPRGFLWDEGFHQMVISQWDEKITMKVISDWLNAMFITENQDEEVDRKRKIGWIPREMILGEDSRSRVPDEFITQRVNIANPPTFLLVIERLINRYFAGTCDVGQEQCEVTNEQQQILSGFLEKIYPRLHYWIQWFEVTQSIPSEELVEKSENAENVRAYRWRGRSSNDGKVVPNTLSSGLDDYPRALFPTSYEKHVDLMSWMIKASQIMANIEGILLAQAKDDVRVREMLSDLGLTVGWYAKESKVLLDNMFAQHYSSEHKAFFDLGINNETAAFVYEVLFRCMNPETKTTIDGYIPVQYLQGQTNFCPSHHPKPLYPLSDGQGGYLSRERLSAQNYTYDFVPRVGYVTIFPFLLKVLPITSNPDDVQKEAIEQTLTFMEDPKYLFTEYGLRSIAASDKFYLKRNSAGDAPYWRGPIWINVNYLALSALHHYAQIESSYQERISKLYSKLRQGILNNVLKVHKNTGFYWEQYDDQSGKGIRGHPFTGWTSSIVNIFFEWY